MKKLLGLLLAICLIAGLLPVVASAAGNAKISIVSDATAGTTTSYAVEEGSTTYLITQGGAANTQTASESNYNIKITYPTGGEPTIYLKDATLKSTAVPLAVTGVAGGPDSYTIVVESDSYIEGYGAVIRATKAHLTITGDGKLSLDAKKAHGIHFYDPDVPNANVPCNYDLTLDEANIELNVTKNGAGWSLGIGDKARVIKINGGSLKIEGTDTACGLYSINGELEISNGAQLDIHTDSNACITTFRKITMDGGHLKLRAEGGYPAIKSDGDFIINGGTMDIIADAVLYGKAPDLSGYQGEYTAVISQERSSKGATPYDPQAEKGLGYYNYFQLTLGASYEVTVKNGTVDKSVVNSGETVTITARVAPEGKVFDKWEVNTGAVTLADPTATSTTFTMPSENVKVTATYKNIESNDTPEESTPEASTPEASTPEASTPEESTPEVSIPVESTPDTDNDEGNKKPAKKGEGSGITVVILVLIVVVSIGIGAVGVILYLKLKANKKPAADEAATEETAEDAEETTEDAE